MAETLGEKLFDLEARIEGVFPLEVGDIEGLPEWFKEFVEDSDYASKAVFEMHDALKQFAGTDYPIPTDVADALVDHPELGWVCLISYCPREYINQNTFQSGWGWTRRAWTHGPTADEAVARALALVAEQHEQSRLAAESVEAILNP